jgi:hypothetical protein
VASRHELRDELSAESACGAGYEDLHDCAFRLIALEDKIEALPVTVLSAAAGSPWKKGVRVTHETGDVGGRAEVRDQRSESLLEMTRTS